MRGTTKIRRQRRLHVELVDETLTYSLREVCERCGVHAEYLIELVEFGILEPGTGLQPREWQFDSRTLLRARKALRLQRDLSLNLPGVAMSMELLDELDELRRQVDELQRQLRRFHGED